MYGHKAAKLFRYDFLRIEQHIQRTSRFEIAIRRSLEVLLFN